MNKKEFLQRLRESLIQMPEEEISAAVKYYEEYFDEAGVENEEKVLMELGSPEQVAKQILADGGIREEKKGNTIKQGKMPIWITLGIVLCIVVLGTILRGHDKTESILSQGGEVVSGQSKVGYKDINKELAPFENIDVEVDMMEVQIMQGDEYKVEIHYLASDEVSYEVKNNTLTCTEHNNREIKNRKNNMTIYVPHSKALNKVNISSGMGDSILENINTESIITKSGMGDFHAAEITCKQVDVELGMGDAKITGTIPGDINIDNGMGDVALQLAGKREDYNYDIDRGMGSIEIDGEKNSGMGEVKEEHNASHTVVISNGMGDTEIEFRE